MRRNMRRTIAEEKPLLASEYEISLAEKIDKLREDEINDEKELNNKQVAPELKYIQFVKVYEKDRDTVFVFNENEPVKDNKEKAKELYDDYEKKIQVIRSECTTGVDDCMDKLIESLSKKYNVSAWTIKTVVWNRAYYEAKNKNNTLTILEICIGLLKFINDVRSAEKKKSRGTGGNNYVD